MGSGASPSSTRAIAPSAPRAATSASCGFRGRARTCLSMRRGHVNPLKLLRGLQAGFVAHGGRYLSPAAVSTIEHKGGRLVLESEAGRFTAARVVIAAGLGTHALAAQVGIRAPLRAQRGHII